MTGNDGNEVRGPVPVSEACVLQSIARYPKAVRRMLEDVLLILF